MAENNLASSSAFCPSISKILPKAASMLAFSPETFAVGDVLGGVANELEAATRIREQYLGVTL